MECPAGAPRDPKGHRLPHCAERNTEKSQSALEKSKVTRREKNQKKSRDNLEGRAWAGSPSTPIITDLPPCRASRSRMELERSFSWPPSCAEPCDMLSECAADSDSCEGPGAAGASGAGEAGAAEVDAEEVVAAVAASAGAAAAAEDEEEEAAGAASWDSPASQRILRNSTFLLVVVFFSR